MNELLPIFEQFDKHLAASFPELANVIGKRQAYSSAQLPLLAKENLSILPPDILTVYQLPSLSAFLLSRGFLPLYHHKFNYFLLEPHRLGELSDLDKVSLQEMAEEIEKNKEYYESQPDWNSTELHSNIRTLITLKLKVLTDGAGNYALSDGAGELFFYFHDEPFMLEPVSFRKMLTDTFEGILSGSLLLNEELLVETAKRPLNRKRTKLRSRNLLHTLAYEAHIEGQRQDAMKWARESINLGNEDMYCHIILAESAFFTGNYSEAASVYEKIVRASQQAPHPAVYMNYGLCFLNTGNAQRAVEVFEEGLNKHKGNTSLLLNLSSAQKRTGKLQDALATAQLAHSLDAANDSICYNLACFYGLMNDAERSAHYLRLAAERDPKWKDDYKKDADFDLVRSSKEFDDLKQGQ